MNLWINPGADSGVDPNASVLLNLHRISMTAYSQMYVYTYPYIRRISHFRIGEMATRD